MKSLRMQVRKVWIAAGIAAALAFARAIMPGDSGAPAYYLFLPFCIFLIATAMQGLLEAIERLEAEISRRNPDTK